MLLSSPKIKKSSNGPPPSPVGSNCGGLLLLPGPASSTSGCYSPSLSSSAPLTPTAPTMIASSNTRIKEECCFSLEGFLYMKCLSGGF
ncbi:unnamed protein product [Meloidogyne enterolobii]|uniref:Uncharacterized protein n=1 Tax=Meloidogyne enterolobii TaxID=390850 RepID=A0ACB0YNG3_MELEN